MDESDRGTTRCITEFVEGQTGCRSMMQKSDAEEDLPSCTTPEQVTLLLKRTALLRELDENQMFELTGCLATCDWNEFRHNVRVEKWRERRDVRHGKYVTFAISTKGRYQEMEEYLLYDFDSFLADVGGYLGLLLGQSLYGIYQIVASKF